MNALRWSVLVALALADPRDEPELVFAPGPGVELVESFEHSWTLELLDLEVVVSFDGEEVEQELPEAEASLSSDEEISYTSEYVDIEDGRARRVRRSYDTLSSNTVRCGTGEDGEEHCTESPGTSELEGLAVVFTRDDDGYAVAFDDEQDADEDLLEGLEADHVLAAFLPDFDAEEGDEWELDLDVFRQISSPGGELSILEEDDDPERDEAFREQFYDNLEGTISVRHGGVREVGAAGAELVVLELSLELATFVEREEELELEDAEGSSFERLDFSFELEGEVLWDAEAGHGRSLRLAGELELEVEENRVIEGDQGEIAVRSTQEFEGEVLYRADVE